MSIRVIQWVWDHSLTEGLDRLLLLAIADNANHDGSGARPGLDELCRKTRMGPSTLYKCRDRLLAGGHIAIDEQGGGRGHRTVYRVVMVTEEPSTTETVSLEPSQEHSTPDSVSGYPQVGAQNGKPSTREKKPSTTENKPSTVVPLTSRNANNRPEPSGTNARAHAQGPQNRARPTAGRCPHNHEPADCWQCPRPKGTPPPSSLAAALKSGKLTGGAA